MNECKINEISDEFKFIQEKLKNAAVLLAYDTVATRIEASYALGELSYFCDHRSQKYRIKEEKVQRCCE
jgi:hypothetical protein